MAKTNTKKSVSPIVGAGLGVVAIVAVVQGNYGGAVFALLVALVATVWGRSRASRGK